MTSAPFLGSINHIAKLLRESDRMALNHKQSLNRLQTVRDIVELKNPFMLNVNRSATISPCPGKAAVVQLCNSWEKTVNDETKRIISNAIYKGMVRKAERGLGEHIASIMSAG